jgi:thiamine kinase-like enzyme
MIISPDVPKVPVTFPITQEVSEETRVNIFLRSFFPQENVIIKPFHRGHQSPRNYLLDLAGQEYVLRLLPLSASENEVQKELYMIQEASHLDLAPKVVHIFERAVLMEYVNEPTLTPTIAKLHAQEIGASIRKTHGIPRNLQAGETKYLDEAEVRYNFIEKRGRFIEPAKEAILVIRENSHKLSHTYTNIHGDLHAQNLFWTEGGFKMIDWEWTVWDNPYLDLSRFSVALALDQESENQFLQGYFGRLPTDAEKEEYDLAKKLNFANRALMGLKITAQILEKEPENPVDETAELKEWESYMEAFSVATKRVSVQFCYDAAMCALHLSRESL